MGNNVQKNSALNPQHTFKLYEKEAYKLGKWALRKREKKNRK